MQDLIVTIVQTDLAWKDKTKNLSGIEAKLVGHNEETDLIVLPEMFNTGFVVEPDDVAENMDANTVGWMKRISLEKKCVVIGSLIIKDKVKYYNRLIWMRPDGSFLYYDKRHLFSLAGEHEKFTQGNEHLIVDLNGWKIMPMICYDLRFPVWSKNRMKGDTYQYDCLIYIANWPSPRNFAWKSLLKARAIENLSYLIGVNRVGIDGTGKNYTGDSAVIKPSGEKITEADPDKETIITVTLSHSELAVYRKKLPFGKDWDTFLISN